MNFITFFLFGLSFGSGPCLGSCGPILMSYIVGTGKNTLKSIFSYLLFSLSRICVYTLLGLLIFFLGRLLAESLLERISKYIFLSGGGFVIIVGMLMILGVRTELGLCPLFLKNFFLRDKKNIVILGLIVGFLPCAPLFAVFSSSALISKNWVSYLWYIVSFGLGTMFSPLLFLVVFAGCLSKIFLNKKIPYFRIFNFAGGAMMMFLGVQLIMKAF